MIEEANSKTSITRLRIGVVFFILWWLPIYLTVPFIVGLFGDANNTKAKHIITAVILLIQGVIGVIGFLLIGKALALTLRKVSYRRLPGVIWRMLWHGDSNIRETDLKTKKSKAVQAAKAISTTQNSLDLSAMLKSKDYLRLLFLAAIIGIPISAAAYYFLMLINHLQSWVFQSIPSYLGFHGTPNWWVLLPLAVASVLVGLTIKYLPGSGGHVPADGFKAGGFPLPGELVGVIIAALASISLGAVVGPEAPLIAIGGGLGYIAIKLIKKDVPSKTAAVVAATGSFAAISTLFGSPLLAAFLLLEASGLGGDAATLVLVPGLLGAGIGSLIFIGLGSLTGLGTMSLVIPNLPYFARPNLKEVGWAIVIGLAAAVIGSLIKRFGVVVKNMVSSRTLIVVLGSGLTIAVLAMIYSRVTGNSNSDVLFSGQTALPYFISHASSFTLGAILLLLVFKGIAYSISLGSFRGGPVFPALFIGAIGGIALSHLPGLPLVPAVAMGIGAMSVSMLRLPITSVMLATLLLLSAGLAVMPLVIVAVVVSFVASSRLLPILK
jgi:H+/Cl- antiporter ClcA